MLESTDINMDKDDGWVAIIMTGSVIHITEVAQNDVMVRFGISSNSTGSVLEPGDTMSISQTVYVKARYRDRKASIVVAKD